MKPYRVMPLAIGLALAGSVASSLPSTAVAATYSFTGSGDLTSQSGVGPSARTSIRPDVQFSGWVTIDVIGATPAGSPVATGTDWVASRFQLAWDGGSFDTARSIPAFIVPTLVQSATVTDSPTEDSLRNGFDGRYQQGIEAHRYAASLVRSTSDTSWLNGTAFDLSKLLAPAPGSNTLTFYDGVQLPFNMSSRSATIALSGFQLAPVPEPAEWMMMLAGMLLVAAAARRSGGSGTAALARAA